MTADCPTGLAGVFSPWTCASAKSAVLTRYDVASMHHWAAALEFLGQQAITATVFLGATCALMHRAASKAPHRLSLLATSPATRNTHASCAVLFCARHHHARASDAAKTNQQNDETYRSSKSQQVVQADQKLAQAARGSWRSNSMQEKRLMCVWIHTL